MLYTPVTPCEAISNYCDCEAEPDKLTCLPFHGLGQHYEMGCFSTVQA